MQRRDTIERKRQRSRCSSSSIPPLSPPSLTGKGVFSSLYMFSKCQKVSQTWNGVVQSNSVWPKYSLYPSCNDFPVFLPFLATRASTAGRVSHPNFYLLLLCQQGPFLTSAVFPVPLTRLPCPKSKNGSLSGGPTLEDGPPRKACWGINCRCVDQFFCLSIEGGRSGWVCTSTRVRGCHSLAFLARAAAVRGRLYSSTGQHLRQRQQRSTGRFYCSSRAAVVSIASSLEGLVSSACRYVVAR